MLHTCTTQNPHFEGDLLHGLINFHKGKALVDDALEVTYETAEGGEHPVLHPVAYNAIERLVSEHGVIDHGPLYGDAAQAVLTEDTPRPRGIPPFRP